jgi:hypothetical protein
MVFFTKRSTAVLQEMYASCAKNIGGPMADNNILEKEIVIEDNRSV